MANSKIYLGNTNIGSLFQGASDISIYLGVNKVYPLEWKGKLKATYSGGEIYDLACDGDATLTTGNTRTNDYTLSAMTEAIIGDCVTKIDNYAFKGCINLTSIVIPNSVINIGVEAFTMCSKITSLTLPNNITNINGWAFYGCSGFASITINATTPPTLGNSAFNNTNDCPIYVPAASVEDYKAAQGWSTYADRIQAIP